MKKNLFNEKKSKNRGFEEVSGQHLKFPSISTNKPIRADKRSAGYDFFSKETVAIKPNESHLFWTDVKAYMQPCEVLYLHVRSSLGIKKSLMLKNTTGVIDSSYYENPSNDGNIGICLYNYGNEPVIVENGERIAQGVFGYYLVADEDKTLHEDRVGGIGSSNR